MRNCWIVYKYTKLNSLQNDVKTLYFFIISSLIRPKVNWKILGRMGMGIVKI